MSNKQKFLENGWDVHLIHENEKPKVWWSYADRLSDVLHLPVEFTDGTWKHIAVPNWDSYFAQYPMKWVQWDGSSIATKWTTRSEWSSMFSVWNLVAFNTSWYCSPDWRSSASGVNLLTASYQLQDEIELSEHDNTVVNRYWSWTKDIKNEITLKPQFFHKERGKTTSNYITWIFKDSKPRLDDELCKWMRIEEIRNNPWLYLHVYSIWTFAAEIAENEHNIEDALRKINEDALNTSNKIKELELKVKESHENGGKQFTKEWIELAKLRAKKRYWDDSIWSSDYKNSKLSWFDLLAQNIDGLNNRTVFAMKYDSWYYSAPSNCQISSDFNIWVPKLWSDDHFWNAVRDEIIVVYKIAKKTQLKNNIYCWSFLAWWVIDVFQWKDWNLTYRTNRYESSTNSQNWKEQISYDIMRYEIETWKEWSMSSYNEKTKETKEKNKTKYDELITKVNSLYGEEVVTLIKKHTGKVLAILENIADTDLSKLLQNKHELIQKALEVSVNSYRDVVLTLLSLIAYNPSSDQIEQVFWNEFDFSTSWNHYHNILWWVPTFGKMDAVSEAYKLYIKEFKDYADISKRRYDRKFIEKGFKSKWFESFNDYNDYLDKIDNNGVYVD